MYLKTKFIRINIILFDTLKFHIIRQFKARSQFTKNIKKTYSQIIDLMYTHFTIWVRIIVRVLYMY